MKNNERIRIGRALAEMFVLSVTCLVCLLAAVGCATNHDKRPAVTSLPAQAFGQMAYPSMAPLAEAPATRPREPVVLEDYRLRIGDKLEIIYHVRHKIDPRGYLLKVEDIVSIEFPFQPQFDQVRTVQTDGKINMLLVGAMEVYGKTAPAVQTELQQAYARHVREPVLTVTFQKSNIQIAELKKAITTAPRGQSRLVPIKPDGRIDLPYIGSVMAFGATVEELTLDVNLAYKIAGIPEMQVTVQMNEVAPQKFYVYGEVARPGVLVTDSPMTFMQAIGAVGGTTSRAEESKVLLIRRWGVPLPEGMIIDYEEIYREATSDDPDMTVLEQDQWLADADIIFVPSNALAEFDDWVDMVFTKGVRSILPYSFNVGLNFGYELRSAPSTVTTRTGGGPNIGLQIVP